MATSVPVAPKPVHLSAKEAILALWQRHSGDLLPVRVMEVVGKYVTVRDRGGNEFRGVPVTLLRKLHYTTLGKMDWKFRTPQENVTLKKVKKRIKRLRAAAQKRGPAKEVQCPECPTVFQQKRVDQTTCSPICRNRQRNKREDVREQKRLRARSRYVPIRITEPQVCSWRECGASFTPTRRGHRFCSHLCGALARRHRVPKPGMIRCHWEPCNKLFQPRSVVTKYCSQDCLKRGYAPIRASRGWKAVGDRKGVCALSSCGKAFTKKTVNHAYCSAACAHGMSNVKKISKPRVKKCGFKPCGEMFETYGYTRRFCGVKCQKSAFRHPELQETEAICLHCKNPFTVTELRSYFCNRSCAAYYREAQKRAAEA